MSAVQVRDRIILNPSGKKELKIVFDLHFPIVKLKSQLNCPPSNDIHFDYDQ